jgi:hypothetical protein
MISDKNATTQPQAYNTTTFQHAIGQVFLGENIA